MTVMGGGMGSGFSGCSTILANKPPPGMTIILLDVRLELVTPSVSSCEDLTAF